MKNILVLQGSGFVGQHVIEHARKARFQVSVLQPQKGTEVFVLRHLKEILKKTKPLAILNCAGNIGGMHYVNAHAADVIRDNTRLILDLYEAVASVDPNIKIVSGLGNCSYPGELNLQRESQWQAGPVHDTVLPFAITKRLQYAVAESYRKQHGIKTVHWLMANNYGPGGSTDPKRERALNGIIVRLIQAQHNGDKEFVIWGTGTPVREWLYVHDVARIMVHSINRVDEQIYPVNVGKKEGYSIKDVATLTARELRYRVKFTYDTTKADGAQSKIMDNRMFRSKYPTFKFTSLRDGISATIAYYKKQLS